MASTMTVNPATQTTNTKQGKAYSKDMAAMVQEGTLCLENGDLQGALHSFEQVVAEFPNRPEGHNNLGALFMSLGDYERAEDCFGKVLTVLPDNPGIYYNRGMARSSQEKFDTARSDFLRVLEYDSGDVDALNNLGVMDFMQGKFTDARLRFQQALEIKPDYPRALLNLCDVEIAAGHAAQAVALCENFLTTYNSIEVRRALLGMLSNGCREALDKAGRTAESLLAAGTADPEISLSLNRIQQAKAVLEETPQI